MAPFFTGIAKGFFKVASTAVGGVSATGGTKITSGSLTYHVFIASGSLTVSSGTANAEVLIVAGGGGGGSYAYGGGGGGGGEIGRAHV